MPTDSERRYNQRLKRENPQPTRTERRIAKKQRRHEKAALRAKAKAEAQTCLNLEAEIERLAQKLIPYFDAEEWCRVAEIQMTRKPSVKITYGVATCDVVYICVNHKVYGYTSEYVVRFNRITRSSSSLKRARDKLREVLGAYQNGRADPLSA